MVLIRPRVGTVQASDSDHSRDPDNDCVNDYDGGKDGGGTSDASNSSGSE